MNTKRLDMKIHVPFVSALNSEDTKRHVRVVSVKETEEHLYKMKLSCNNSCAGGLKINGNIINYSVPELGF